MRPPCPLRTLGRIVLLLLFALVIPKLASSQSRAPVPAELASEVRERLAQAAENSRLAPWQRDVMLRLARTGQTSARETLAADLRPASPALAPGAADGAWDVLVVPARSGHSAIYDPVRDRMVVFGGYSGTGYTYFLNDVWVLSLAGMPAWTQLTPTGTPPSARYGHSAIYDPVRDRMVVFGGGSD